MTLFRYMISRRVTASIRPYPVNLYFKNSNPKTFEWVKRKHILTDLVHPESPRNVTRNGRFVQIQEREVPWAHRTPTKWYLLIRMAISFLNPCDIALLKVAVGRGRSGSSSHKPHHNSFLDGSESRLMGWHRLSVTTGHHGQGIVGSTLPN